MPYLERDCQVKTVLICTNAISHYCYRCCRSGSTGRRCLTRTLGYLIILECNESVLSGELVRMALRILKDFVTLNRLLSLDGDILGRPCHGR
jgi:hypothetical protein